MASSVLLASEIMDMAAARLNDVNKSLYTYVVQIPFLNIALAELQELYQANNVPITDDTSEIIQVDAVLAPGILEITFDDDIGPGVPGYLPDDLIELKRVWQSSRGVGQWSSFGPVDTLPPLNNAQTSSFNHYQWTGDRLKVMGANANMDIKLDYMRSLFPLVTDAGDQLSIVNGLTYLANRTASLIAHDIEENDKRSADLYTDALGGLDRSLTITTKGRQKMQTRRRPFRASYKRSR